MGHSPPLVVVARSAMGDELRSLALHMEEPARAAPSLSFSSFESIVFLVLFLSIFLIFLLLSQLELRPAMVALALGFFFLSAEWINPPSFSYLIL